MSPILLRPIREQFEHDRVIRQLEARWRRKFDVGVNVGAEEGASVRVGTRMLFPDLVLTGTGPRRLHGVVEVETQQSVNPLEAKAEWAHFAGVRGAFYLYVPAGLTDIAERLCQDGGIDVSEIWAYYAIGAQVKFSLSYRSPQAKARHDRANASRATASASGGEERSRADRSSRRPAARTAPRVARARAKETTRGGAPAQAATRSGRASKRAGTTAARSAKQASRASTAKTAKTNTKTTRGQAAAARVGKRKK